MRLVDADALDDVMMRLNFKENRGITRGEYKLIDSVLSEFPTIAQPERLTDDDFETIRIHLSAIKGNLCNQHRWKEAEEYQRLLDRFMSFATAQPQTGHWKPVEDSDCWRGYICDKCGKAVNQRENFCPNCGARMVTE